MFRRSVALREPSANAEPKRGRAFRVNLFPIIERRSPLIQKRPLNTLWSMLPFCRSLLDYLPYFDIKGCGGSKPSIAPPGRV